MAINTFLIRLAIISTVLMSLSTVLVVASGQTSDNSEAIITNTGSIDMEGYVITVSRSGDATCKWRPANQEYSNDTPSTESLRARIPMPIVNKLFADLDAVKSVSSLPDEHHSKNDPLASVTYITYRGQTSPDLSCSENAKKTALYDDIAEISAAFASKEDADDTAPVTPTQGTRKITLADSDKTIQLKVGQTIILDLGSNCDWAIKGFDQGLLDQKQSSSASKGSPRIFQATTPGITMLSLVSGPGCTAEKSSAADAVQEFQVSIFISQ